MDRKPKVCLSGFVLSSLMFDCMNSQDDQEGFLIGTIAKKIKKEINDQSMYTTQEELVISIYSSVPSGGVQSFYNSSGHIRMADIESCLGERKASVVGWYKFRRHSPAYPSFHETLVHRELKKLFSSNFVHEDDCLIFGVLTSSNISFATHSFDYAFFVEELLSPRSFKNLTISLLNLGDTKGQYRMNSDASAYMESTSFNSVLSRTWDFNSCWQTEDQILEFHKRLRDKLDNLQEEMTLSDAYNASLEHEVKELNSKMQSLLSALELPSSHNNPDEPSSATDIENQDVKPSLFVSASTINELSMNVLTKKDQYFVNEPDQPIMSSVSSKKSSGARSLEQDAEVFEKTFLAGLSKSERELFQKDGKSPKLAYLEAVSDLSDSERTTQAVLSKLHDILIPYESSFVPTSSFPSTSDIKISNLQRTVNISTSGSVSEEQISTNVNISTLPAFDEQNKKQNLDLSQAVVDSNLPADVTKLEDANAKRNNSDELSLKRLVYEKVSQSELQSELSKNDMNTELQPKETKELNKAGKKDIISDFSEAGSSSSLPPAAQKNLCISTMTDLDAENLSKTEVISITEGTVETSIKSSVTLKNEKTENKELLSSKYSNSNKLLMSNNSNEKELSASNKSNVCKLEDKTKEST
ncbi:BRISC complex subunit Abraxas 2-like [Uloborus diversus]|uniref:BRISC complex subunit Abraxas 2-like n=1 Tax=Uloborus diversus TaxID=327109 RepID=UPI0024097376|nr:BRISC complex subunit Abraxas 2-like [Uloborus diversus]